MLAMFWRFPADQERCEAVITDGPAICMPLDFGKLRLAKFIPTVQKVRDDPGNALDQSRANPFLHPVRVDGRHAVIIAIVMRVHRVRF